MVSGKMIEGAYGLSCWVHHATQFYKGTPKKLVQAVVNAAWVEFDADDESTWPDEHKWLFWETQDGNVIQDLQYFKLVDKLDILIRYADPQDLMFKGDE